MLVACAAFVTGKNPPEIAKVRLPPVAGNADGVAHPLRAMLGGEGGELVDLPRRAGKSAPLRLRVYLVKAGREGLRLSLRQEAAAAVSRSYYFFFFFFFFFFGNFACVCLRLLAFA